MPLILHYFKVYMHCVIPSFCHTYLPELCREERDGNIRNLRLYRMCLRKVHRSPSLIFVQQKHGHCVLWNRWYKGLLLGRFGWIRSLLVASAINLKMHHAGNHDIYSYWHISSWKCSVDSVISFLNVLGNSKNIVQNISL